MTINEKNFNKKFGSFRSEIENTFSVLSNKFKRFNNNGSALQISDIKIYNLQFRVACLLKNMSLFIEKYNIKEEPHHVLWFSDGFEFPSENKQNIVFSNERKVNENYNKMLNLHEEFLKLNLHNQNITKADNTKDIYDSDDEMNDEYIIDKGKRIKLTKQVVSVNIPIHK